MKRQILLLSALTAALLSSAQVEKRYVITGSMTSDSLYTSTGTVKKLYLTRNVKGSQVAIDSATVKNRSFVFKGVAPETVDVAFITGFDNGSVQLFLEPGEITVKPFDARFPVAARAEGTANNDVLAGFQKLNDDFTARIRAGKSPLLADVPAEARNDEKTFLPYQRAAFFGNRLYLMGETMKFVRQHLDAPATLYIIRYNLFRMFSPRVVERQLLRALSPELHEHPLYKEMENLLAAAKLAVGEQSPVFEGQTADGQTVKLTDLRGNYVLIDFWASWCGPCRREFPFLKQALTAAERFGKFKILSYSIDDKKDKWLKSIKDNQLENANWTHISTLKGWASDVVSLFNIKGIPHTVLLNPEGKVVAFNLRGEELVNKIKAIAEGKESYE